MPACYIPGVVIAVAVFGAGAIVLALVQAAMAALDSLVMSMEQLLPMGALAAKLTLAVLAVTVAVEFVALSGRYVRRVQARRMAVTGQPCAQAQAGTCSIDCAVKDAMAAQDPAAVSCCRCMWRSGGRWPGSSTPSPDRLYPHPRSIRYTCVRRGCDRGWLYPKAGGFGSPT